MRTPYTEYYSELRTKGYYGFFLCQKCGKQSNYTSEISIKESEDIRCPFCGTKVDKNTLKRNGLDPHERNRICGSVQTSSSRSS